LRRRYLEPLSAANVLAHQLVVDAHHIITRIVEACTVLFAKTTWGIFLLGTLQPANIVVISLTTKRTAKAGYFGFLSLVKYFPLMHKLLHSFIVRPTAAFGRDPVNDLIGVSDVTRLAVNTVREIYL